MKKNKKLLIALLCVMLLAIAMWIAAVSLTKEPAEDESQGQTLTVIKSYDIEGISAFTLKGTERKNEFVHTEDGWIYNGDPDFPLNSEFTDTALQSLSQISAVSLVEENVEDLSRFGLSEPQMEVTVTDRDGETDKFLIGDYNSFNGYHYLCVEGVNDVFQVDTSLVDLCSKEESDFIKLDTLPDKLTADSVTEITVSSGDTEYTIDTNSENFDEAKESVGKISLEEYADYHLSEKEKADYGFDNPTEIKIRYSETVNSEDSSSTITSAVYYDYTIYAGAEKDGHRLITVEDSSIVYKVESDIFSEILK